MTGIKVKLIAEEKTSIQEVANSMLSQKTGTRWAERTNELAINYARHLAEVYGDVWYKGFLPEEYFPDICLPKHGHFEDEKTGLFLTPHDATVRESRKYYKDVNPGYSKDCLELIKYFKGEIGKNGFTESIVLVVINGKLKHVDGLHRLVALGLLLEEGYQYKPIPVFLCDARK